MATMEELEPRRVWAIFDEITRVPRPSKHEERIRAWLLDFARRHGIEARQDEAGNVVMRVPATRGYEAAAGVVLQSHMDMVCEKNAGVPFDFLNDAIRTRIDGEWVRAEGTTLGADDGIGMAAALAALTDPVAEHGPLEALFTVDEETGLTGAFALKADMLHGRYLLNLDSEDEGEIFIGCAGGIDTVARFDYAPREVPAGFRFLHVAVGGLSGGHSGDNIGDGLANACKLVARLLYTGMEHEEVLLSRIEGGNLRNAIPREAAFTAGVAAGRFAPFRERLERLAEQLKAEYATTERGLCIDIGEAEAPLQALDARTARSLTDALVGVANGVLAMSATLPGLVETSTNLASIGMEPVNRIGVVSSQRSSVESAKAYAAAQVEAVFRLAGASVSHSDGYPGWTPDPNAPLLKVAEQVYVDLFGTAPRVRAIHAGLECGLFLEKYPEMQMISFGPTLRGVHSPDERMEIDSVKKFWLFLTNLLKQLR